MSQRFRQIVLITSILWLSWLTMMLVHECGHDLGALATGGTVRQVVWHPTVISRTDVQPNPHPLIEIWAGPVFGSLFPASVALAASLMRLRAAYLLWVVAGFCLIANGAYVGIGAIDPIGDAHEMVSHGQTPWPLAAFGLLAFASGVWIWHRVSPRLGFGDVPVQTNAMHAYLAFAIAAMLTLAALVFGNRGV